MWRWECRSLRNRRRRRMVLLVLALAGLFVHLRFQLLGIRVIEGENDHGARVRIETSSRAEGTTRIITTGDHTTASRDDNDQERTALSLTPKNKTITEFSVSTRKATKRNKPLCAETQEKSRFREVGEGTLVYSVWYDDRKPQHFIRVLLLSVQNALPPLTCHFESTSQQNTSRTSEASFYKHNENHGRRFGAVIASCVVPEELGSLPCFVKISTPNTKRQDDSDSVVFPVGFIDRQDSTVKTRQYGICIPPMYGEISVDRIIEFLELSQILGASHFTFYDLAMPEGVRKVLNYYEEKKLVSVLEWNLPSYLSKQDMHYFAQPLSIMDCLYRSMKHILFVAFNDLDEFIVPLQHNNIIALMENIHKDEHCGHCFQSVTFDPSLNVTRNNSRLLTQTVIHRTSQPDRMWTKCVVDPRRIFEQGIHHISKQNEEYYHADKVSWDIARVFHYRKCKDTKAAMQPSCVGFEVDKTMQKFGKQLQQNFESKMNAIANRKLP